MIYIDKNESPLTPLDNETMTSIITNTPYNLYPDEAYQHFKEAYAQFYQLSPSQLIAANGSDELIQKLMLIMPEGPVLTLNPDFFMYQAYASQVQRPIEFVQATSTLEFKLNDILQRIDEVQPSFFIMSNPHNPSGKQRDLSFLTTIANKMKDMGGYFVIDEAYLDYGDAYQIPIASHILRMRTLSKAFGIAGLRLGVLISTPETIQLLERIEHPYPLNVLTLNIATHIFENDKETSKFIATQRALAQQLRTIFDSNVSDVMTVYPSKTNFVLTQGEQAQHLGQFILNKGFKPRFYDESGMEDLVRYSIATYEQLQQLEQIIKDWRTQYDISQTT